MWTWNRVGVIARAAGTVLWRCTAWCRWSVGLGLGGASSVVSLSCWALLSFRSCCLACRCAACGRGFRPCTWIWLLFMLFSPRRASGAIGAGYIMSSSRSSRAIDNWHPSWCCLCFCCYTSVCWFLHILCLGCLTIPWFVSCPKSIRLHDWCSTARGRISVYRHPLGPMNRRTLRCRWRAFYSPWLQGKKSTLVM